MSFYPSMRNTVVRLLGKFGDKDVVSVVRVTGTFDPITGKYGTQTVTTTVYTAAVLPLDKGTAADAKFMEGRSIGQMRKVVFGPGVSLRPGLELRFQGASWNVEDCAIIDPDGSGSIVAMAYVSKKGAKPSVS